MHYSPDGSSGSSRAVWNSMICHLLFSLAQTWKVPTSCNMAGLALEYYACLPLFAHFSLSPLHLHHHLTPSISASSIYPTHLPSNPYLPTTSSLCIAPTPCASRAPQRRRRFRTRRRLRRRPRPAGYLARPTLVRRAPPAIAESKPTC